MGAVSIHLSCCWPLVLLVSKMEGSKQKSEDCHKTSGSESSMQKVGNMPAAAHLQMLAPGRLQTIDCWKSTQAHNRTLWVEILGHGVIIAFSKSSSLSRQLQLERTSVYPHRPSQRRARSCASIQASTVGTPASSLTKRFNEMELEQWQIARKHVEGLGFTTEEADTILAKGFGCSSSSYWGEEKVASLPEPEAVLGTLVYLRELGVSEADLAAVVKQFPEAVGLIEGEIRENVTLLDSSWGINGTTLKNLILRNPHVLGYNVDCKGDCMGECTRCWVRF